MNMKLDMFHLHLLKIRVGEKFNSKMEKSALWWTIVSTDTVFDQRKRKQNSLQNVIFDKTEIMKLRFQFYNFPSAKTISF